MISQRVSKRVSCECLLLFAKNVLSLHRFSYIRLGKNSFSVDRGRLMGLKNFSNKRRRKCT